MKGMFSSSSLACPQASYCGRNAAVPQELFSIGQRRRVRPRRRGMKLRRRSVKFWRFERDIRRE